MATDETQDLDLTNCAQTINYLLQHSTKALPTLSHTDLSMLQNTLKLVKIQVARQLITQALLGKVSELEPQIQSAKQSLESYLETLTRNKTELEQKATYPEFEEPESIAGIPNKLQANVRDTNFGQYQTKKAAWEQSEKPALEKLIASLEKKITRLTAVQAALETPEKFVQTFLADQKIYPDLTQSQVYTDLVRDCALTMAANIKNPGETSIGLTRDEAEQHGPLFNVDGKTYTLNPQAVSIFLRRIHNPSLIAEIDNYHRHHVDPISTSNLLSTTKSNLQRAEGVQTALADTTSCQAVEAYLSQINENLLINFRANKALQSLNTPTLPFNPEANIFLKIYYATLGKATLKKAEQQAEQDCKEQRSQHEAAQQTSKAEITHLQEQHADKLITDPQYKSAYTTYLEASNHHQRKSRTSTSVLYSITDPNSPYSLLSQHIIHGSNRENFAYLLHLAKNSTEEKPLHTLVSDEFNIGSKIQADKQKISQLEKEIPQINRKNQALYDSLSDEARFLIDSGIDSKGLQSRYVDLSPEQQNYRTPFVSALVLEALLKLGNVAELDKAFQIKFTSDELERHTQDTPNTLLQSMKELLDSYIIPSGENPTKVEEQDADITPEL